MNSPAAPSDPILRVDDLHVQFSTDRGVVHAVRGISFSVRKGEVFGLVGETGCGKTMTGLSLLRLIPPPGRITQGRIRFEGQNLLRKARHDMRKIRGGKIAMIFQDPSTSLNPVFTIGSQLGKIIAQHLGGRRHERQRRVLDLLEDVGLPDPERIARSYPHQLSGGMQQRVMIAWALAADPDLLIADEPTTALDVTIQAQILELLVSLQQQRSISIILITHNLSVVAETCHRVAVLYAGRIVEIGPVSQIFECPQHPYTQGLLRALPAEGSAGQALQSIPGEVPTGLAPEPGCAFAPRCTHVMDRCRTIDPPMFKLQSAHETACFLCEEGTWNHCEPVHILDK